MLLDMDARACHYVCNATWICKVAITAAAVAARGSTAPRTEGAHMGANPAAANCCHTTHTLQTGAPHMTHTTHTPNFENTSRDDEGPRDRTTHEHPRTGPRSHRNPSLGFWLRVTDSLAAERMRSALDARELTRRDWRTLGAVARAHAATGEHPEREARMRERLARADARLHELSDRGFVAGTSGAWELTATGTDTLTQLRAERETIREQITAAVTPEALATTTATLEAIARELGWEPGAHMKRPRAHGGHRRGCERRQQARVDS